MTDIAATDAVAGRAGYLVGVDIGGTKIEAVLIGPDGRVVASRRVPARRGGDNVLDDVASLVRGVAGDRFADVAHVGIGTPGRVDAATGRIANVVNLDIDELDLGSLVSGRLGGIPVHVDNDVNAAAVGAARVLCGDDLSGTVAFLNFGTGLAAGVLVDGVLQHGYSGAAGEVGHVPVDPNRFDCPCGQRGCLETVCSGASVARLWPTADGRPPMPDLIAATRRGDGEARRVLAMVTHAIGDTLQIVAQSVDPRLIVIGGGMAKTGGPLLEVILDELHARESACPFLKGLDLGARLRLAPVDAPVGAIGAAWAS
ncbi:ROK family protein [Bifidobacterium amazonense]|uniref:ROK family protein n=1 Tax=Bifidobacterium amazonense TaxID=2809027 RepID=A0ABS9VRJ1_9BIFI|nr:ROK family protein [Bifidobacterium amazonense]MCH9274750.1 ROK family protein [Bifidobacterium amazonense]